MAGDYPAVDEVESPQVVHAVDMVRMGMGEKDRVDVGDPLAEGLPPEVRRGVYEDVLPLRLYDDGSPGSLVPWVVGRTDGAVTANHGDTGGCSTAEDGYLHAMDSHWNMGKNSMRTKGGARALSPH